MNKFKVAIDQEFGPAKARIAIEPLEQGYGHTLGNSLRRCMLNSLMGSAITGVKIEGVSHQFSTVKGVIEDVIQIILNLKKVRVKIYNEDQSAAKPIRLILEKTGEGPVTAADINTQGLADIINLDQHIATITDPKLKFKMELIVEQGVGYVPTEEKRSSELGVLSVDALYSPVLAVNYTVDPTRVGRRTDFDRLNLDVTTDGTITPLDAVNSAAKILTAFFKQVYEPQVDDVVETPTTPSFMSEDVLKQSVEELDLPVRITNALKAIEIDTIEKLLAVPRMQLMKAKNLGSKSITLIQEKLTERGLSLGEA